MVSSQCVLIDVLVISTVLTRIQIEDYRDELEEMENMSRQEYVAHLRRY